MVGKGGVTTSLTLELSPRSGDARSCCPMRTGPYELAKYSDLAKNASTPFLRGYYRRIAERYITATGELSLSERQGNYGLSPDQPSGA
jgi:hypothetical protein